MRSDAYTYDQTATRNISSKEATLEGAIENLTETQATGFAGKILNEFVVYKSARVMHDDEKIAALRNHKGVYSPSMNIKDNESHAFVKATSPKVRTACSLITPVVLDPSAWGVEPPASPSMPVLKTKLKAQGLSPEQIRNKVMQEATKVAANLATKIKSGLEEDQWEIKLMKGIQQCAIFGTMVFFGPTAIEKYDPVTVENEGQAKRKFEDEQEYSGPLLRPLRKHPDSKSALMQKIEETFHIREHLEKIGLEDRYRPTMELLNAFELYYDPVANTIEEASSVIRRRVCTRSQMRKFRDLEGFDKKVIDKILHENPNGNWFAEPWESSINTINTKNQFTGKTTGRFVIYERWGPISGKDLKDAGADIPEDMIEDEVMGQTWVCGGKIIRCESSELHSDRLPFYIVPYEAIPFALEGQGVPEMMKDSQAAINAAERSKNNNMASACKPNWEIKLDQLAPGESANARETTPGKVWFTISSETSKGPAVRPFIIPSILKDLDQIQAAAKAWSDEQTAIPAFLAGEQGAGVHNRTLGGAALQFSNSIASIKGVVLNMEKYLFVPMLDRHARFHQLFSNDPGIVGQYRVVARALQGLIAKELILQKLQESLQMVSALPGAKDRVDYEGVSNIIAHALGMDEQFKLFVDDATYEKRMKENAQQQAATAQAQNVPKLNAEVPRKNALLDMLSDSKATPAFAPLLMEVAQSQDALTPDLKAAIDLMVKESQVAHIGNVHKVLADPSGDLNDPGSIRSPIEPPIGVDTLNQDAPKGIAPMAPPQPEPVGQGLQEDLHAGLET